LVPKEQKNSTAASKVTDMLKSSCGVVSGVPQDASAKCLRVGGVNEVVERCNNLLHGIIRGNWEMKSINTVFEYLIQTFQTLNESGRAISFNSELNDVAMDNIIGIAFSNSLEFYKLCDTHSTH